MLHAEVIFGGHVYHMDDAADGYYPGHIAVRRAFAAGELPTWERGSWCGWPLNVDPYNGVFYPLNVLYYVFGAARGLGPSIALHVFLGGVGMWLLLRRRRLAALPALFGGLAYELSSFGVVRIRHVIFVQMMAWLPWILWAVERYLSERRRRDLALVSLATALALVAGALSIGHFAALGIAAYTVARCVPPAEEPQRARRFALDTALLGGAAVLGALAAAAQIVPTVAHLPYSPRSLGSDYRFASSYAWPNLGYLWTLLSPNYWGGEDRGTYHGAPNHWELCGYYVGKLPWLLAPLAFVGGRLRRAPSGAPIPSDERRGPERWVLLGLVLLAIGLALGDAAPVHPFFYRHVPLYAALRCPARALLMVVLAVPILGAHGVQAFVAWIGSHPQYRARYGTMQNGKDGAVVVAFCLCVLAATDTLTVGRGYVAGYHKPADNPDGFERFAAVDWLLKSGGPPSENRMVNDPRGPFRLHNIGMVLGLENASGYDSVAVWRYVDFLHLLRFGRRYPHKELRDDFAAIGVWNLDSRLVDLMNIRWVVGTDPPGPRFTERFRPTGREGGPAAKWEPYWNANLKVFENTTALPRAFVAHAAEVPGSDDRLAARLLSREFDPGRTALLEEPPPIALPPSSEAPPVPGRVVAAGRHRLAIETDDPLPGILMVSDVHYPGWTVTVDGQPAKLLRADWTFRGVALPAGHHRVEMTFASTPTRVGLVLSALALLAIVALAL